MGSAKGYVNVMQCTPEERRELGRKGGIASGKKRRERKAMREQMEILLTLYLKDPKQKKPAKVEKMKSLEDIQNNNLTVQESILLKLLQGAMKGNIRAIEMILNLIGEGPKQEKDTEKTEVEDMNALQQLFAITEEDTKADEERQREIEEEMAQYATNEE